MDAENKECEILLIKDQNYQILSFSKCGKGSSVSDVLHASSTARYTAFII